MEYTRDVISDRFGVAGGSAVASDGVYYWRVDAADYITEYGTAIPSEAIERMQSLSWEPPSLDRDQQTQIYQDLMALLEPPAW